MREHLYDTYLLSGNTPNLSRYDYPDLDPQYVDHNNHDEVMYHNTLVLLDTWLRENYPGGFNGEYTIYLEAMTW